MAQHKSAKKRARQNPRRRARNRHVASGVHTAVKAVHGALEGGDSLQTTTALRDAERSIRKAASKGVLSKKQASRTVSRLAKSVNRSTQP